MFVSAYLIRPFKRRQYRPSLLAVQLI